MTMEEKEHLFIDYQNGDETAMMRIVSSHFNEVIEYVSHFSKKHEPFDTKDMIRYINSCLFKRMQICTSIHSYEKDVKRLIQREALKYMNHVRIVNNKETFDFIDLELDENMLKVLNDSLEPDVYYVFYQMVSGISADTIANKLDISLMDVRKRYVSALEMLESFLIKNEKRLKRRLYSIKEREGEKSTRIKITPYGIDSIIIYFYLKNILTSEEQKLYYYQVFSKYEYYGIELQTLLKVNEEELQTISDSLNEKIGMAVKEREYQEFAMTMKRLYGPYLYNLVKSENTKKFDFESIREVVHLLSFEDIKKFLSDDFAYITANEKKLLYKYYYKVGRYTAEVEDIERDINLNLFGYKQRKSDIMPMKYWQTFQEHQDEFDEAQKLFLECYYFKKRDKREFIEKYPESSLYYRYYTLIARLEKLYYNVNNFTDNAFNRTKWLMIRDRYKEKHNEERVRLLDLFYGVNGDAMTIKEIHKLYPNLTYIKIHDLISDARDAAINVYINKKHKIDITKDDYIPYLDMKYEYTDETRNILIMFLKENLSYEEISKRTGLNKTRISNIITDGIRKIDHYRLGVLIARNIDTKVLEELYDLYPGAFTDQEIEIHRLRYEECLNNVEIGAKLNLTKLEVNKVMGHLYRVHEKYLIKDVNLSEDDIKKELNRHFTDRVLTDKSRTILSLAYGIKCDCNELGEKLSSKEIQNRLGLTVASYHHGWQLGNDVIKLRKVGAIRPDFQVFERDELAKILEDKHLPISDKERDIICALWNLYDREYMDTNELAKMYGDNESSIRRRYYRAMVSIKKYLNGEIEEQINFEEDLVPILKYFSKSDRIYIYEYYKNGLGYQTIAKKYHLTPDMLLAIINRIKITIYEITHSTNHDKLFDFDYYETAINDPDLPFYGDLNLARQIFELYFGMNEMRRLSIPEIKERLQIDLMTSAINNAVYFVMLSVCKLKDGIKKQKEFSLEEIKDYYEQHYHEMDSIHRIYYDRYFKKMATMRNINGKVTKVPEMITYDLLKSREPNLFHLEDATKEELLAILNNDSYILDSKTKHTLMDKVYSFGDLDGRDINHVYRIIGSLLERNLLFIDKGKSYRLQIHEQ